MACHARRASSRWRKRGLYCLLKSVDHRAHEDRGRKLRPDQHLLMTDLSGRRAEAVACPLDESSETI